MATKIAKRKFIAALCAVAVAWLPAARAQQQSLIAECSGPPSLQGPSEGGQGYSQAACQQAISDCTAKGTATAQCVNTEAQSLNTAGCNVGYVLDPRMDMCVCSAQGAAAAQCTSGQSQTLATPKTTAPTSPTVQLGSVGICPVGFVPREAYTGDRLCVSPGVRSQTILDNIAAPSRTKPDGTCVPGYVWRQAVPSDHVCVAPATRTQAQSDNRTGVLACPIGQTRNASGACVCPTNEVLNTDGKCVSAPGSQGPVSFPGIICPPGQVSGPNGISCVCGAGQTIVDGKCESTQACPPGQIMVNGRCTVPATCPPGEVLGPNGNCVQLAPVKTPTPTTESPCPSGEERNADGACVKPSPPIAPCPPGEGRTDRGCEKEPTQSNPNVQTPSKVLTPPKPVTVQKPVPTPKLNIAKPPPPALKLPSGPENKQKR